MHSIIVINVYFGKYPNYFHLWLKSAAANSTIDFLLVTDQALTDLPSNVKTLQMTMDEFSQLATKKIGIDIHITRPYKLCDFKVTYGLVFEDYISGYDFWGHCDVDVIWGDLRCFITNEILNQYDRVLLWGHLSLYKNTDDVNRRFMLDGGLRGDYKTVLQSEKSFAFDESTGITSIYKKHGFSQYDGHFIAGIDIRYSRYRVNIAECNFQHQVFYYQDGHVYRAYYDDGLVKTDEFAYIHLHQRKFTDGTVVDSDPDSFFITKNGFIEKKSNEVSLTEIKKMNPYKGKLFERIELKYQRFKQIVSDKKQRKEIREKKYRFLHIYFQHDFKFGPRLVKLLEDNFEDFHDHLFVTRDIDIKNYFWNYENVVFDERKYYKIINDYGKTAKLIILHSFFEPRGDIFRVKWSCIRKIVWRTWGHDQKPLFGGSSLLKSVAGYVPNKLFARIIRNFYGVGIGSICDKIAVNRLYGAVNTIMLPYINSSDVGAIKQKELTPQKKENAPVRVLLGHSALGYLNHIKMLEKLSAYLDNDILVIVPLAYGTEHNIKSIRSCVEKINSNKIKLMLDYIPYEDYLFFLSTIDIAVFDQKSSAALGNIVVLAYFGKKIYLNKEGIIREEFEELGIEYGITDDIGKISFEEFSKKLSHPENGEKAYKYIADTKWAFRAWNELLVSGNEPCDNSDMTLTGK